MASETLIHPGTAPTSRSRNPLGAGRYLAGPYFLSDMTEPFVSAEIAAKHLAISLRRLLDLVRSGDLPAYPLAWGRKRNVWRFRLSDLEKSLEDRKGSSDVPLGRRTF